MPTTSHFKRKQSGKSTEAGKKRSRIEPEARAERHRPKRRPGREESETLHADAPEHLEDEQDLDELEDAVTERAEHDESADSREADSDRESVEHDAEEQQGEKVEIQFKGSELLRAKFPKSFELAEVVATHWLQDGDFEGLPIGHPLGQWAAQQSLLRAKRIEKKLMASPIVEKAAIKVLTVGMQAQGAIEKLKERLSGR